jgi:hypothetical protein
MWRAVMAVSPELPEIRQSHRKDPIRDRHVRVHSHRRSLSVSAYASRSCLFLSQTHESRDRCGMRRHLLLLPFCDGALRRLRPSVGRSTRVQSRLPSPAKLQPVQSVHRSSPETASGAGGPYSAELARQRYLLPPASKQLYFNVAATSKDEDFGCLSAAG